MASLEERIARLRAPQSAEAEVRARAILTEKATSGGLRRRLPRAAKLGLGTIVAVGLAVSPPGQALAERLGELVGIGDEPTVPTRIAHRPGTETGAVVIGSGTSPSGAPMELVAFRVRAKTGQAETAVRTCYALDLPPEARSSGDCITKTPADFASVRLIAASSPLRPESQLVVQGLTSTETASVEMTYTDADGEEVEADVIFGSLTETLGAEIEAETRAGMFVALLPPLLPEDLLALSTEDVEEISAGITLIGRDSDGAELWRANLADIPDANKVEIPYAPGDALKFDVPPADNTSGARPLGSGISSGPDGVNGVPTAHAYIGSGTPSTWLEECEKLFSGRESRLGIGPNSVQMCGILLAKESGALQPGQYSREELTEILRRADVIPPEHLHMLGGE